MQMRHCNDCNKHDQNYLSVILCKETTHATDYAQVALVDLDFNAPYIDINPQIDPSSTFVTHGRLMQIVF